MWDCLSGEQWVSMCVSVNLSAYCLGLEQLWGIHLCQLCHLHCLSTCIIRDLFFISLQRKPQFLPNFKHNCYKGDGALILHVFFLPLLLLYIQTTCTKDYDKTWYSCKCQIKISYKPGSLGCEWKTLVWFNFIQTCEYQWRSLQEVEGSVLCLVSIVGLLTTAPLCWCWSIVYVMSQTPHPPTVKFLLNRNAPLHTSFFPTLQWCIPKFNFLNRVQVFLPSLNVLQLWLIYEPYSSDVILKSDVN